MEKSSFRFTDSAQAFSAARKRIDQVRIQISSRVEHLDLSRFGLTDLPPEIGRITWLRSLNLTGNRLPELPREIWQLTSLRSLQLSGNRLTELPKEIGRLTALRHLQLTGNRLRELPSQVKKLTALRTLRLGGNRLTELRSEIGRLIALELLDLSANKITTLPSEIGRLPALELLDLSANEIVALPPEIGRLPALKTLQVEGNPLPDPYPRLLAVGGQQATQNILAYLRGELNPDDIAGDDDEEAEKHKRHAPEMRIQPVPDVISVVDFDWSSGGRIVARLPPEAWPQLQAPANLANHRKLLATCRRHVERLVTLLTGPHPPNVRREYRDWAADYRNELPTESNDGNIFIADAAARTLRQMFESEASILPIGLAAALKTLLEDHQGLRTYYPAIADHYRRSREGHQDTPLPLDAVESIVRLAKTTPAIFDDSVPRAIEIAAKPLPATPTGADAPPPPEPNQPVPPPDPIVSPDPEQTRQYTTAGIVNALWDAFRLGEKLQTNLEAWISLYNQMVPFVGPILEWLRVYVKKGGDDPSR